MRPIRSFLLLLIFLACFTGLHYIIPVNHFFPSISEYIPADLINYFSSEDKIPERTEIEQVTDTVESAVVDTIIPPDTVSASSERLSVNPLQGFNDSLRYSRGQLRVMYYGDSQIEGDRITSYLRNTLRKGHGGTGPGLFLPLMPVMYTKSLWIRSSSNWKRYNYLSYKAGEISHRNLGPFMAICRYLPEGVKTSVPEKAFVRIKRSNFADSASAEYDFLRVFYGNSEAGNKVTIKADDEVVFADTLERGRGFKEIGCLLNGAKDILIEFVGRGSPDIYGISIESKTGVIVDNIPQRGSAGLEFTMVGRDNLEEAYRVISPDLFILQYGLNIVKNVRDEYTYYQKGLERQLKLLKEISPLTTILVISLTDMALNDGDSIKSYRNIPAIIDAQKRATEETGVTFWDSYSAMGGESSIIKWAEKKSPLAQKDFVHFTYPGADSLSKILADALFPVMETDTKPPENILVKTDTVITTRYIPLTEIKADAGKKSFTRSIFLSLFRYNPDKPLIFSTPVF